MGRDYKARDARRREREDEWERECLAKAEALEAKDRLSLDYIIETDCADMEGIRYVLLRMAKTQALQLELIKGLMK